MNNNDLKNILSSPLWGWGQNKSDELGYKKNIKNYNKDED
jgi:hypothetical protein